jgi:ZIP family zinc transporter
MLFDLFSGLNPIYQALIATLFTWLVTALGAGLVFFFKTINRKALIAMLGFAAGVWSILRIIISRKRKYWAYQPFMDGHYLKIRGVSRSACLLTQGLKRAQI